MTLTAENKEFKIRERWTERCRPKQARRLANPQTLPVIGPTEPKRGIAKLTLTVIIKNEIRTL